ncbi:MAG TPA: anhydro-N-acetylmuramic acid kinase [Bacteroidia bacterium]|nr:anhydro-N-acetylmuramic acid kinase [Bacteroidia bacterium]
MGQKQNSPSLVLGLMSGTSLDGLDMALCEFAEKGRDIQHRILQAQTVQYDHHWKKTLELASGLKADAYFALHAEYGRFMASCVKDFIHKIKVKPQLLASHGHTVFHRPELGYSTQLGCGATLAAQTGINTVCDFRSLDVALGGQGAPLVPIGDKLLFPQHEACLNLGGIVNISYSHTSGERLAFDICPGNMLLNHLAQKAGQAYDGEGSMARSGQVNEELLVKLNQNPYFSRTGARSLGREWFEAEVLPVFDKSRISMEDKMCTASEHIAEKIAETVNGAGITKVLLSGGGVYNLFLLERLRQKSLAVFEVPDDTVIQFKEALIFALLGYLRAAEKSNTLKSVTGATRDAISGALYLGESEVR